MIIETLLKHFLTDYILNFVQLNKVKSKHG